MLESFFAYGPPSPFAEKEAYNPLLVIASYIVASFGSYAGLVLASRMPATKAKGEMNTARWLGAFALGVGIWSMHFIGMLAYQMRMLTHYDFWLTFMSMVIAIAVAYFVILIIKVERLSWRRLSISAVLLGLGISTMHYMGMAAIDVRASLRYVPWLFFLSITIAILASGAALWIFFTLEKRHRSQQQLWRIVGALIMGVAICGMHFTGMKAAVFIPFPDCRFDTGQNFQVLAISVISTTIFILSSLTFAVSKRLFLTLGCSAVFALPIIIIDFQATTALTANLQAAQKERSGLYYHAGLFNLLQSLVKVNTLSYARLSGDASFDDAFHIEQSKLDNSLSSVDEIDSNYSRQFSIDVGWRILRQEIVALQDTPPMTPTSWAHTRSENVINALIKLMEHLSDTSDLTIDPQLDSNHLVNALNSSPDIVQTMGQLSAIEMGMLFTNNPSRTLSGDEQEYVRKLLYKLGYEDEELEKSLEDAKKANDSSKLFWSIHDQAIKPTLSGFERRLEQISYVGPGNLSGTEVLALSNDSTAVYATLYRNIADAFLELLAQREAKYTFQKYLILISSSAGFLGFVTLFVFLYRSLTKTERSQHIATKAKADLDLRLREKEQLEQKMLDYTSMLELSRADIIAGNEKLQEEESKIRTIMDIVLEGIITTDLNGIILSFNGAAERIFGYKASEVIGRPVGALMPEPYKSNPKTFMKDYFNIGSQADRYIEHEFNGVRKNGGIFPLVLSVNEINFQTGNLLIGLVRDVSQQKEKEEILRQTTERAEAANKTKSDFLANMSHELRTPLNSVLGMTHLLMRSKLDPDQYALAKNVVLSSTNLLEIVNDILDLSKIEAGEMRLESIGFDPRYLLQSTVHTLAPIAQDKNLVIHRHYESETFPYMLGDPTRLGRILINLLANAIKYTEVGSIEIRALCKKLSGTRVEFFCSLKDTGIGIAPEKQATIFNKFVQADTSITRKYGGTGLGLAITEELVRLMGGIIGMESEPGKGSTFWISIPFEITYEVHEDKYQRNHKSLLGTLPPADARVLIAEDHPMNQILIKQLMQEFGIGYFEVASNGRETLKIYQCGTWHVILMDCHMPEMSGYDTTIAIRDYEKSSGAHVPIIAMTANAMRGDREKCLLVGMDDYISKPIHFEELRDILGQWIRLGAPSSPSSPEARTSHDNRHVDLTVLRTITGGDLTVEIELMKAFIEQSDTNIQILKEHLTAEGPNKLWSDSAHMLKGGSSGIGAELLSKLCEEGQHFDGSAQERQDLFAKIDAEYARVKDDLRTAGLIG